MSVSRSRLASTQSRRAAAAAVALSVAVLGAGCGSSSKSDSPTSWADGVCSSIATWKTSVTAAADSVTKGGLTKDSLQSAADQAKAATSTLESDLKKLGKPDSKSGQQARDTADQLSASLTSDTDTIKKAIDGASGVSGVLTATATVSATLVSMASQVQTAITSLQQLDPKGDLQKAFSDSSSCQSLASSTGSK
jgi:hypothetical protein